MKKNSKNSQNLDDARTAHELIEKQTKAFLMVGGAIENIPTGMSGQGDAGVKYSYGGNN